MCCLSILNYGHNLTYYCAKINWQLVNFAVKDLSSIQKLRSMNIKISIRN